MTSPDTDLRILELLHAHHDMAECFLCGQYGEDVEWFITYSPESHGALQPMIDILERHGTDIDAATEIVLDIAAAVDPIAKEYGGDFDTVCTDCASADSATLRRRIRVNADQLDEAGYSAPYGPDSDDLADHTLRDRGLWVRRHVGYELTVDEPAVTPITKHADQEDRRDAAAELNALLHPGHIDLDAEIAGLDNGPDAGGKALRIRVCDAQARPLPAAG